MQGGEAPPDSPSVGDVTPITLSLFSFGEERENIFGGRTVK